MRNVAEITVKKRLCVSCGICKAVCPCNAISYVRESGIYIPNINNQCIECGMCLRVCPGIESNYPQIYEILGRKMPDSILVGDVQECYVARVKEDDTMLANATSGGVVTAIITECLDKGLFDSAFCVDTHIYNNQITTNRYSKREKFENTQKSRYVPVSHEKLIAYMKNHPDEKIIITAVSCAMQGIVKAMDIYNLNRENYLLLGLFCDRVLSYNVFNYFENKMHSHIDQFFFRDKKNGGWPGNICIRLENGNEIKLDAKERMKLKDFFQLERCLYCVDKLNQFADISFGDNYTNIDKNILGSNSIILRTNRGRKAWEICEKILCFKEIDIKSIVDSQAIKSREQNITNGLYYEKKENHTINTINQECIGNVDNLTYKKRLHEISLGGNYLNSPHKLHWNVYKKNKRKSLHLQIVGIRTVLGKIKRIIIKSC